MAKIKPQFPLYIPSKGRSEYMITSRALTAMEIDHFIIAEPAEIDAYRKAIADMELRAEAIELDLAFKDRYQLCDQLGLERSSGPGPARNFAWDHSIANGHAWHWVMDDNIKCFRRLQGAAKIKTSSPAIFAAMEDFVLRYRNVAMAGPNYSMFAFAQNPSKVLPFNLNTRIYSCNLIRNDTGFRWRGRYNEDTILSLDMLKAGWCTIQFNAFLAEKMGTQVLPGGNTAEFYHAEGQLREGQRYADGGTDAKSKMLVRAHPDCAELVFKYGRVHHRVNYRPFRHQKLIKVDDPPKPRDYGLRLIDLK